jgi:hypothetical protein
MSDGATGQPVEAPADTPGSSTAPETTPQPPEPAGTAGPTPDAADRNGLGTGADGEPGHAGS